MSELEKAVLAALTKNHNDGEPTRLAYVVGKSWSTVKKAVLELEALALVDIWYAGSKIRKVRLMSPEETAKRLKERAAVKAAAERAEALIARLKALRLVGSSKGELEYEEVTLRHTSSHVGLDIEVVEKLVAAYEKETKA